MKLDGVNNRQAISFNNEYSHTLYSFNTRIIRYLSTICFMENESLQRKHKYRSCLSNNFNCVHFITP